jgi:hypothetical protein
MGHTISLKKRSAMLLRTPLADFVDWRLIVDCGGRECARERAYDAAQLVQSYPGQTVSEAIRRMRCTGCGCSPVAVQLRPGPSMPKGTPGIALIGPGSV